MGPGWIDAFAAGIGTARAAVMLEPDGLGIIPWHTDINGNQEWCRPAEADPATAGTERFAMLNYAVDRFKALGHTSVYLEPFDPCRGCVGVGFFLIVSNFEATPRLLR